MRSFFLCITLLVLGSFSTSFAATPTTEDLWEKLREPGHISLLRHALAPGTGDPSNFDLNDCTTQRNLSDIGRAQAKRIGERFRRNGIEQSSVYTSQWCRCRETAALLGLGEVIDLPALNSFFGRPEERPARTAAMRDWIEDAELESPTVLVTHQVNITALTRIFPTSGEIVVVRRDPDGDLVVLGSIETDP